MKKGFTLIELIIVVAVIGVLVAIIIPAFRGMQQEGWISQAEGELKTLQSAVESYYKHRKTFPSNIRSDLTTAQPRILKEVIRDPFKTSLIEEGDPEKPYTYGYMYGVDTDAPPFGPWYIIYSRAIKPAGVWGWDNKRNRVGIDLESDDVVVSNGAVCLGDLCPPPPPGE